MGGHSSEWGYEGGESRANLCLIFDHTKWPIILKNQNFFSGLLFIKPTMQDI